MRLLISFLPAVCIGFIGATSTLAQNLDERRTEEPYETYHKHYDRHHGHNHAYPDRGAIIRDAPRGAILVNYAGVSYRFADGVWFEPRGPAFIVVTPPIGLVVSTLPAFATRVDRGSESYLYTNDIYYRSRPDLGGYEVVNDPEDGPVPAARSIAATAPAASPVSNPTIPDSPSPAVPVTATLTAASAGNALPITAAQVTAPTALPMPTGLLTPTIQPVPTAQPVPTVQPVPMVQPVPTALPVPAVQPVTAAQIVPPPTSVPTIPTPIAAPIAAPIAVPAALPAASPQALSSATSRKTRVIAYPKNEQTPEVQARDHYECYRFAVAQTGFDPMRSNGAAPAANGTEQADYERAQAACFEGRGYTVR